jgi:outer membrane protein OmpA-like peptidoglycan-associated protein
MRAESLKGGKMMRYGQIMLALAVVGIVSALGFPGTLRAQGETFIDCREHACSTQEILDALKEPIGTPRSAPKTAIALNVYFATNSARLSSQYYPELNKLGEVLTRISSPIEISGHTDSTGSAQANKLLSERRAMSVKQYLERRFSLPSERLLAKGYGSSQPRVTPDDTEESRRQNRRIEVGLLK